MLTEDNILTIPYYTNSGNGKMTFDLKAIANDTGKKVTCPAWTDSNGVRYRSTTEIVLPIPHARKMLNYILDNAEDDEIPKIDGVFKSNPKLYEIWREKLGRKRGTK